MVLFAVGSNPTLDFTSGPAGWTLVDSDSLTAQGNENRVGVWTKESNGAESNPSITWDATPTLGRYMGVLVYRNAQLYQGSAMSTPATLFQAPLVSSTVTSNSWDDAASDGWNAIMFWANRNAFDLITRTGTPGGWTQREHILGVNDPGGDSRDRIFTLYDKQGADAGSISASSTFDTNDGVFATTGVKLEPKGTPIPPKNLTLEGFTAFSFAAGATDITLTLPGGTAQGDLIVIAAYQDNTTFGSVSIPTGYTQLAEVDNGNDELAVFYKIAGGSEGNPTVPFGGIGGGDNHAALAVFRDAVIPTFQQSGTTGGDPAGIPTYSEDAGPSFEFICTGHANGGNTLAINGFLITSGWANVAGGSGQGSAGGAAAMMIKENANGGSINQGVDLSASPSGGTLYIRARVGQAA
jgi:hypothetical protein